MTDHTLLREEHVHAKWLMVSFVAFVLMCTAAQAESVFVKYRGEVDLAPFDCSGVDRSSLVQRVCYERRESYMIINLNGTYYH